MFISLKNSTTGASTGTKTAYNSGAFVLTPVLVGVTTYGFLSSILSTIVCLFIIFLLVITLRELQIMASDSHFVSSTFSCHQDIVEQLSTRR